MKILAWFLIATCIATYAWTLPKYLRYFGALNVCIRRKLKAPDTLIETVEHFHGLYLALAIALIILGCFVR